MALRACLRCHSKKIKCTGHPDCIPCALASVPCQPALKEARARIVWLEDQIHQNWGINCADFSTGTTLEPLEIPVDTHGVSAPILPPPEVVRQLTNTGDSDTMSNAPDLSLIALNATGDMRYLGPSSGAFFAAFATSIARSFTSAEDPRSHHLVTERIGYGHSTGIDSAAEKQTTLSSADARLLLQSYEMWIQPLYPLLHVDELRSIVKNCQDQQTTSAAETNRDGRQHAEMVIFYLVMALGAINRTNTVDHMRLRDRSSHHVAPSPASNLSPAALYLKSLYYFDHGNQNLQPSIYNIQVIILISIYGSYGPVGSSQWQLAGLAMRMATEIGLHHSPRVSSTTEKDQDQRNRVFWTTYSIEISLAYNLGRPPSVGDDYITAVLPSVTDETQLACHYIEHRRIQSKILSRVYCANQTVEHSNLDRQQTIIADLQADLDCWKSNIPLNHLQVVSAYPKSYWERLYHGTSFVLHRSSPLCPNPSPQSLEKCVRAAGAYLNNMISILRTSHVPLSWMLVQGVVFAGLTMLITGRKDFRKLAQCAGVAFMLVDFPAWARTCSVCLAIINERWREELISKLETHFEALANDTLRVISLGLTSQPPMNSSESIYAAPVDVNSGLPMPTNDLTFDQIDEPLRNNTSSWDQFDTFKDFLGFDETNALWDMFTADTLFDEPLQTGGW
nr:hypothetical protein [Paramyrothecium roridum]